MRLYLLPVSTRRTLLYAQRLDASPASASSRPGQRSLADKTTAWAAAKWAQWEKQESGWQRKVVDYGNHAFRRIPFEEWGLKSVPPLSARRRDDERAGRETVQLVFPAGLVAPDRVRALALRLATERLALHRKRMVWCFVGMPATLPFVLIPVIPNLPFFYLVYRAWSHWRAIAGGRHVQWLVENKLLLPSPSKTLDQLYGPDAPGTAAAGEDPTAPETMLLTRKQVRAFSNALDLPPLEIELERAIWQVERALSEQRPPAGDGQESSPTSAPPDEKRSQDEKR
ncbi:hypothetical protein CDD83_7429 [Cordyceps sp. RAO-2017]|nr:hypothetical protein CDD83_7429 [Cordyceps sp. RAO-2017]